MQMDAVFAALASTPGDTYAYPPLFLNVPADAYPALAAEYRVASVPAFIFVHAGRVVSRVLGADPPKLAERAIWIARVGTAALEEAAWREVTLEDEVMVLLKGSPDAPQCGFSRQVVDLLRRAGVVFGYCDVLKDVEVREGVKKLHNWPTYPQVYARGRLVGGVDRVRELAETGLIVAELARDEGEVLPGVGKRILEREVGDVGETVGQSGPGGNNEAEKEEAGPEDLTARLQALVKRSRVMLFMKGSPEAPQCGFSRRIVAMLQKQDVEFDTFDILQDSAVRQGLKDLFKWPTFPQLYSEGELIGGLDIIQGLVEDGSLKEELGM